MIRNPAIYLKAILSALTIFIFMVRGVYPQPMNADSLKEMVTRLPANKEKTDKYIQLARHYQYLEPDSAWYYCEMAYNLANEQDYPEGRADALYIKSMIANNRDNYREALSLNERFIGIADSLKDEKRLAKGYYQNGVLHSYLLDHDNALKCYSQSLPTYLDLQDTLGIMANYNAIGNVYLKQAKYDSASVYFLKSLEIIDKSVKKLNLSTVLSNLGEVYLEMEQFDKAHHYVNRSIESNEKAGNLEKLARTYILSGRIYAREEKYEEALEFYEKAREIFTQIQDTVSISDIENNLGVMYQDKGDYERALQSYNRALEGYLLKNYTRGIITVYGNMGVTLSMQGNYKEAIVYLEKVVEMSRKYDLPDKVKDAYNNMSCYWMELGDYKKAYEFHTRYSQINDSIFNIEKTRLINDLTMKYEKEKDQAQILELEKTNLEKDLSIRKRTNQRNAYFFTGLGVLSLALFITLYLRQRSKKDKIIAQHKIHQLEEEKKLLAAKLLVEGQEEERKRIARELHDGLGVLLSATKMQFTSIKDTSPENKSLIERATQLLDQATGDVRKISHNMMPGLLTRLGLYEAVEDLFENLTESGKLNAICEIQENLDRIPGNQEIMVYRIIQEMVNNSLKHADATTLRLSMRKSDGMVEITYSDDGKGFDLEQKLASEASLGLKSIQSRVDFLNGTAKTESSPGSGTSYYIQIPG